MTCYRWARSPRHWSGLNQPRPPTVPDLDRNRLSYRARRSMARLATEAAAWAISWVRDVELLPMDDGECEQAGVPYGSTSRAIFLLSFHPKDPWWWLMVWSDQDPGPNRCLHLQVLGWGCEVHHVPKGHQRAAQGLS